MQGVGSHHVSAGGAGDMRCYSARRAEANRHSCDTLLSTSAAGGVDRRTWGRSDRTCGLSTSAAGGVEVLSWGATGGHYESRD